MERRVRYELAGVLRERYRQSEKSAKTKILDEFVAITGHHRKYAVRLLNKAGTAIDRSPPPGARRIYDEAVKEALIVLWEASDRICGKRLKAILPQLLESMECHGRLKLEANVRELLLAIASPCGRLPTGRKQHRVIWKSILWRIAAAHSLVRLFIAWSSRTYVLVGPRLRRY